jgi:hypothetical protein
MLKFVRLVRETSLFHYLSHRNREGSAVNA